ncbi:hypothetical protein TRIP_C60269 [Candidatus Zixiibacteriota bacterium]|nr:hypothetical protein TRIP_C60269 [candidate division Zixibacteria bacterium]
MIIMKVKNFGLMAFIAALFIFGCQKKSIEPQGSTEWRVMGKAERFSFGTPVRDVMVTLGDDSCLTDTAGVFSFSNITPGKYQVMVKTDDFKLYSDSLSVAQNTAYIITLQDSANLVGQVRNLAGANVPGAVVSIGDGVDTTDIDGIYRFKSALSGKSSIYCYFPGYYPVEDTVTVTSNYRRRDLTLQSEFNLVGYVRNRSGLPISGAIVSINGMADTTNETGYYEFALIPTGNQTITCNQPEYYPFQDTIALTAQQKTFIILMGSKYNLVGYVSHAIEGPIKDAVVSVGNISDTTGENGYYQLALVPRGRQVLKCKKFNYFNFIDTLDITGVPQAKNIVLRKIMADTVYVTEDAMIRYSSDYDSYRQTNYGQDVDLGTYSNEWLTKEYYWVDGQYDEMYVRHYFDENSLFKLPQFSYSIDTADYVGAFLVLNFSVIYYGTYPSIMKVSEPLTDWSEDEITFDNRPGFSHLFDIYNFTAEDELQIDVSSFYRTHSAFTHGIVLNTPSSEAYLYTDSRFYIISSECSDKTYAPKVIIMYAW